MKWRDVVIGAVSTLLVTIIAGIVIFYATREPEKPPPAESLIYQVEKPVTFQTDKTTLSLLTIRAGNFGDVPADNVLIGLQLKDVEIADKSIHFSTEPAATYTVTEPTTSQLNIKVRSLAPNETIVINLLLSNNSEADPVIGMKSDKSIGEERLYFGKLFAVPETSSISRILDWILPIALMAQIVFFYFSRRRFINRRLYKNANNTAFLLLHNGISTMAETMLEDEIKKQGGDCYLLSNYALCLALKGDFSKTDLFLNAADIMATSKHDKAVVTFNRALTAFLQGNVANGLSLFENAYKFSPKDITKYCKNSKIVEQLRSNSKEFANIVLLRVENGNSA